MYDFKAIEDISHAITIDKNNWSKTVEMYDWCTGTGTENDPYVIQNVKIDIKDGYYGIKITKGTNFIIRNCIFTNTSDQREKTSGIYVIEAENGVIEYNNFTFCKTGIFSVKAKKMDISYNSFVGDFNGTSGNGKALWISEGEELVITYNYIVDYYYGIGIRNAKKNKVENNHIENYKFGYDVESGITFNKVNDSTIINNDFYGMFTSIQDSKEISVSDSDSDEYYNMINLYDCYNIEIYGNRFHDMSGDLISVDTNLDILTIVFVSLAIIFVVIGIVCVVRKKLKN